MDFPLWVILVLPFAKILATSLSIGSGGSGGIFGPGMVIGGFLGAGVWRILEPIAPAMVAVGVATLVVGDRTIYKNQLRSRAESPAYRFRFGMPLLGSVPVDEAMAQPQLLLDASTSAGEALERMQAVNLRGAPVVDSRGVLRGTIAARTLMGKDAGDPVGRHMDTTPAAIPAETTLEAAVEALATSDNPWVPVLDYHNRVVGIVATSRLVREYRIALRSSLRRLERAVKGAILVDQRIGEDSVFAGLTIAHAVWPPGTVVVTIQRGDQLLVPHADTVLLAGDIVSMLASADRAEVLREELLGPLGAESASADGRETTG